MDANQITALGALFIGLLGAAGGTYGAVVRARRDAYVQDRAELRARQEAWVWVIRLVNRMRSFIAANGLEEPEEWQIDQKVREYEARMDPEHKSGESGRSQLP